LLWFSTERPSVIQKLHTISLFGARKSTTFQRPKERAEKFEINGRVGSSDIDSVSSGIGAQMIIARGLQRDPDGRATTSEIAREDIEEEGEVQQVAVTLTRQDFNRGVKIHNAEVRAEGHPSQQMEPVLGPAPCNEYGNRFRREAEVHTISHDSSLSPPPTTSYGGSKIYFPDVTPQDKDNEKSTEYWGSLLGLPPSAVIQDPFSTPRTSGNSILATRYIQLEEDTSMHADENEED
jgi:hypothetical protein